MPMNPWAFPLPSSLGDFDPHDGMPLRDYFAAKALSGLLASYSGEDVRLPNADWAAAQAYEYADAMLKARGDE